MGSKPSAAIIVLAASALFGLTAMVSTTPALAEPPELNTPATQFHGLPNNNPSRGGSSANPKGGGVDGDGDGTGGGGIHNITTGRQDTSAPGQPARNKHGGLNVGIHGEIP